MFGMIKNSLFGGVELNSGTVIQKQEKDGITFEERSYEGGKFATTEVSEKPFDEASKECVLKLLKYVGGSNDKENVLPISSSSDWKDMVNDSSAGMGMTAPVSMISYPTEEETLQPKVKVILRIPNQFQADPPLPTDESIQIENRDGMTVYSTQFGGFAKEADYVSHAAKLRSCLGPEASYHKDYYICSGYDPPMKPYGRRNEVWFVKNT